MFVFAVETEGKIVALIQEDNRAKLDEFLNGERDEGRVFRRDILSSHWDGKSPFTARLATPYEERDFFCMNEGIAGPDGESCWYFYGDIPAAYLKNQRLTKDRN
jgi:hypothetical protein